MQKFCKENKGNFLRYADDCVLTIYSHDDRKIRKARNFLQKAINDAGFIFHPEKNYVTKLGKTSAHAEVVGAKVNEHEVISSKKFRNKIRGLRRKLKATINRKTERLEARILGMTSYAKYLASKPFKTAPRNCLLTGNNNSTIILNVLDSLPKGREHRLSVHQSRDCSELQMKPETSGSGIIRILRLVKTQ
jgi:hypothetical protein